MKGLAIALAVAMAAGLAGCDNVRNEDTGTVVGGVLGGVLGSQVGHGRGKTAATIAGALAGAFIGGRVGRSMDETDRLKAQYSLEHARTGETTSWHNPDTGARYAVTPTRTYTARGTDCRDYNTDAWIEGRKETVTGTACRQPDGSWRAI